MIAAKELCLHCLRHSNLDAVTVKECTRRKTPLHWLGNEATPGGGSAAGGGKGGQANVCLPHQYHGEYIVRFVRGDLQCRAGHAVQHNRTNVDYRPEHSHRARAPYRTVLEVNTMLGDGRREKSSRLFFLEVTPHRGIAHPWRVPAPFLVAAYGASEAVPVAEAASELPLLRERFNVRPSLTKGELAQQAGPIELVISSDMQYWPRMVDRSRASGENLFLMKLH